MPFFVISKFPNQTDLSQSGLQEINLDIPKINPLLYKIYGRKLFSYEKEYRE